MSTRAALPERRRSRLRKVLGILLFVAIVAAGVTAFQLLRGRGAGPATAETTEAAADSAEAEPAGDGKAKAKDGEKDDDALDERVPVEVAAVERSDVPAYFSGTASLVADNSARILARTNGQIIALHVEEGDIVEKNDVLLELDGGEQKIALEERNADLITLKHELERQQALFDQNLGSESDLLATKARYEAAEARRRAAELSVAFTQVRAPFSGVVTQRLVDLGEHVQPGTEVFHLADTKPLLGSIYMPERQVGTVSVGQPVEIRSDAVPDEPFHGRIRRIAPIVDSRTGTVKVTIELDDGEGGPLVPGSFVRVLVETDRHDDTLTIPQRAVIEQGGESFAFRIDGEHKAHRVRIETGYGFGDDVEVLSGLAEGDRIVTAGHGALRNDTEVRIIGEPDPRAQDGDASGEGSDGAGEEMAQSGQGS